MIPMLSFWEPWGSLMAYDVKQAETRPRPMRMKGTLGIATTQKAGGWRVWNDLPVDLRDAWSAAGIPNVTHGAALCTVQVEACVPTEQIMFVRMDPGFRDMLDGRHWKILRLNDGTIDHVMLDEAERPLGNYAPGRFVILTHSVKRFPKPIPGKGKQGIWYWDPEEPFRG